MYILRTEILKHFMITSRRWILLLMIHPIFDQMEKLRLDNQAKVEKTTAKLAKIKFIRFSQMTISFLFFLLQIPHI